MAGRPIKDGLDYYPIGVDWLKSIAARRIGMKVGAPGLIIYQYLLGEIYQRGYYLRIEDYFIDNLVYELTPIIKDTEDNIRACVNSTLDVCVEVGCFDRSFRQVGILTSKDIQKTYIEVCKKSKRKNIVNLEYSLIAGIKESKPIANINSEEMPINSEEIPINSEEMPINSELIQQRKGKEIKGNIKEIFSPLIDQVYLMFQHNRLSEEEAEKFYDYYSSMGWTYEDGKEVKWKHAAANWIKNIKGKTSRVINF